MRAMTCQPSAHRAVCTRVLCLTVDTRVPRFCVGPGLVAILLNTYGEEFFLSPSAYRGRHLRLLLDSAPVYNDAAVLARAIRIRVVSNPLSLPAPCTRKGFEFEFCPVGGAIEF